MVAAVLDTPLPPSGLDRVPEPPFANHNHAIRVSRLGVQVAEGDPAVVAGGEYIDGARGHILIEHDVVAHDGSLKGTADKTNPGKWGGCSALAGSIPDETALVLYH